MNEGTARAAATAWACAQVPACVSPREPKPFSRPIDGAISVLPGEPRVGNVKNNDPTLIKPIAVA